MIYSIKCLMSEIWGIFFLLMDRVLAAVLHVCFIPGVRIRFVSLLNPLWLCNVVANHPLTYSTKSHLVSFTAKPSTFKSVWSFLLSVRSGFVFSNISLCPGLTGWRSGDRIMGCLVKWLSHSVSLFQDGLHLQRARQLECTVENVLVSKDQFGVSTTTAWCGCM